MKILQKTILALILIFLVTSCTLTKIVWQDKSYTDNINRFLIGKDGRYLVLIGKDYHYVLTDNSKILKEFLTLEKKDALRIDQEKTNLKLNFNNEISGTLVIKGYLFSLSASDKRKILLLGVKPNYDDYIEIKIKISGKRYLAKYLGVDENSQETIQKLKIYYDNSSLSKNVGRIAVTPITITIDAVLLIGKIALVTFTE